MPTQTIYLIRHGEVDGNILMLDREVTRREFNEIVLHTPHELLNEKGRAQITSIIPRVASLNLSCLYASPLTRTQQSARLLADALNLPLITRSDLYELLPAPLHGPPDQPLKLRHAYLRSGVRLISPWTRDSETAIQAFNRIRRALQALLRENRQDFGIVGHQGIFRLLFLWVHAAPGWRLVRGDTTNGGISIITHTR
jgi:broad specificity phosphatase PhoE